MKAFTTVCLLPTPATSTKQRSPDFFIRVAENQEEYYSLNFRRLRSPLGLNLPLLN